MKVFTLIYSVTNWINYGIKFLEITDFRNRDKLPALSDHYFSAPFFPLLVQLYELAHFVPPLVRSAGSHLLVIHVATLSLFCSVRNLIHRVTSNLSSRLQQTRKHMSMRLFLSILRMSTETRCISRPLLFQMRRLLKPKRILFYQLLPVVLPEGLQSAESMVGRTKLIAQSVHSNVGGADPIFTHKLLLEPYNPSARRVRQQYPMTGHSNCLNHGQLQMR